MMEVIWTQMMLSFHLIGQAEDTTNAQKALFAGITDVNVIDSHKVQVVLDKPNGNFLFNLAWGDAVIVSEDSIENIKQNPVGTGAFVFDRGSGDRIELKKNNSYWGVPAKLEKATFKFISDPSAAIANDG